MKKNLPFLLLMFVFLISSITHAAEEKKQITVKDGFAEGVVIQFDERKADFGKEEAVDIPIKPFNKEDYEADPQVLEEAFQTVDSFGYPRRANFYSEHAKEMEELRKAEQAKEQAKQEEKK